jgi:hypothetical protein
MQEHCHARRGKTSVSLSPRLEALERRKLRSELGPGPVADYGTMPMPTRGTEVIHAHKVVAFRVQFATDVNPPPPVDIQEYRVEIPGSVHRIAYDPPTLPLASATYDQSTQTLTLTPLAPARARPYRVVKQGSLDGADPPIDQLKWQENVVPPSFNRPTNQRPSWSDKLLRSLPDMSFLGPM